MKYSINIGDMIIRSKPSDLLQRRKEEKGKNGSTESGPWQKRVTNDPD